MPWEIQAGDAGRSWSPSSLGLEAPARNGQPPTIPTVSNLVQHYSPYTTVTEEAYDLVCV